MIILIDIVVFYSILGKRDPEYFRQKARENRETNKKIKQLWDHDSNPGETFSSYKKRIKNL